ncbi:hypothetical protein JG687_00013819 [Phytophthora cactorum]|uniref:RxLR effector protein n=1 Tax=Phytophthora cactorum TaxID=29920 RepID=A0A329RNG8_9STRA|nr:hypothetical protein Pcac1_g14446 [Phytophthora cactorum]KAG2795727.1 hypothetical protein PC111_g22027 [Phytophthora cactorum]KAG2801760.1 hypothetical protein PC112_g19903 [Phytophthora cactorum]KAG2847055.1 hypothetical protein PC113_g17866 [Phytophthora cactorum]KAG2890863.1 hypothetical protein PC115_g19372 [Phytophthora cactorum]
MSLGFLHLVGADQSISDQSRLLRRNTIAEGDNEERGIADVVEQLMAKNLVDKLFRTNSFSAFEKTTNLGVLKKAEAAADVKMKSMLKTADEAGMRPKDMATKLNDFPDVDDALRSAALQQYTNYLQTIDKVVD